MIMANLAIRGHATRGKEVIEILEMLGGENIHNYGGTFNECYVIDHKKICTIYTSVAKIDGFEIFTLEEFLKKFPYKVGDKVNSPCKGCIKTITSVEWNTCLNTLTYKLDNRIYTNIDQLKVVNELQFYKEETMEKVEDNWAKWDLPDGYEFQDKEGNVINTDIIKLVKKQPQYPKTYEECCEVLGCKANNFFTEFDCNGYDVEISDYEDKIDDLLQNFRKLIYYRDAYWKIAGEQMGLGKPWEPDWNDLNRKYFISLTCDGIGLYDDFRNPQVLAFPTEEMRDAFFENFKDLIEQCKELL